MRYRPGLLRCAVLRLYYLPILYFGWEAKTSVSMSLTGSGVAEGVGFEPTDG